MIYRLVVSAQGTMSGKIKFIEIILDFIVYLNRKYVTIWVSLIAPKQYIVKLNGNNAEGLDVLGNVNMYKMNTPFNKQSL